jgi:PadR family transcriptional regulator, regulatory protein AphA
MSLRHALLGLLADHPMTGYDLTRTFDRSLTNVWPASHSQIYPELARLSEAGLIRQVASGSRGKKVYEITREGLAEIHQWLRTEPDHWSRNPAFLRVFFLWLMEPEEAIRFLENEYVLHEMKLLEFKEGANEPVPAEGGKWAFRLGLEWGIRYELGILEWNAWAREQVAAGSDGRALELNRDGAPRPQPVSRNTRTGSQSPGDVSLAGSDQGHRRQPSIPPSPKSASKLHD